MSSAYYPDDFLDMVYDEMEAQGLKVSQIQTSFKEDFPQAYFLCFEEHDHTRKMTKNEAMLVNMIWVGYLTGFVRRAPN